MPKHTRKLRRVRRGGDENSFVVPKQVMPANENDTVKPLLTAKAALQPASLRILKPKYQSSSEFQTVKSNLNTTPKSSTLLSGMARRRKTRRTRRHR